MRCQTLKIQQPLPHPHQHGQRLWQAVVLMLMLLLVLAGRLLLQRLPLLLAIARWADASFVRNRTWSTGGTCSGEALWRRVGSTIPIRSKAPCTG